MFGSSVESFWTPNYDTGFRLGDIPQKSSGVSRGFQHSDCTRYQLPAVTVSRTSRKRITAERRYITAASAGLAFEDDVIREQVYCHCKTYPKHIKQKSSRGYRNDISYLNKPVDHFRYLKPVKPVKASYATLDSVAGSGTANGLGFADIPMHSCNKLSFQRRKCSTDVDDIGSGEEETVSAWDEYLLIKLSANTARWLVQNPATSEDTRNRLHNTLNTVYGRAADDHVELVEEDVSETSDEDADATTIKKSWLSGKDM